MRLLKVTLPAFAMSFLPTGSADLIALESHAKRPQTCESVGALHSSAMLQTQAQPRSSNHPGATATSIGLASSSQSTAKHQNAKAHIIGLENSSQSTGKSQNDTVLGLASSWQSTGENQNATATSIVLENSSQSTGKSQNGTATSIGLASSWQSTGENPNATATSIGSATSPRSTGKSQNATATSIGLANSSSDMPTVVFVAGLEGSGHHLLDQALDQAFGHVPHKILNSQSSWSCGGWSYLDFGRIVSQLRGLSRGPPHVYLGNDREMLSYPCGRGGENKPDVIEARKHLWHPRLEWLQEATDQAGVRLRVVFLHRGVSDLLASNCLHRNFDNCSVARDVLASNAHYLSESIKMLEPQQCACFKYGEPEAMERAMIQSFGMAGAGAIKKVWRGSGSKYDRGAEQDFALFLSQLRSTQRLLDMACDYCSAKDGNGSD